MIKPKSLKVLDTIKVPEPCSQSWESMNGNDRSRFCEQCAHSVTNLSALTKEGAATLLANRGSARLCVRYSIDHKGDVLFKPTITRAAKLWQASAMILTAVMTLVGLAPTISADDQTIKQPEVETQGHTIGIIAPPTPANRATPVPARHPEILGEMPMQEDTPVPLQPADPLSQLHRNEIVGKMVAPQRK